MEASKTAAAYLKDLSPTNEAEVYFNHYKALSSGG